MGSFHSETPRNTRVILLGQIMGFFSHLFYPWGILLQVFAVILFLGPPGALIYLFVEALPDLGLVGQSFKVFPRRRRIGELKAAIIDNPSAGNYEELADLYMEDGNFAQARACYDKAISSRTDSIDPFYRRGVCEIELEDYPAALADLQRVVSADEGYDFHRAKGLLAEACAKTGQPEKAEQLFLEATKISTLSETYYNYAQLLNAQGKTAAAKEWAQKILDKKRGMPRYLQRRERPWFRRATAMLAKLTVTG
jgi:tetratricopeptide (TPR) repeat protein